MITLGIPGSPTAAVMPGASSSGACNRGQCFLRSAQTLSGADCQHVYGECHRRPHCPALRPGLCRHPQDAFAILIPVIVYVCAIGAYAVNNSTLDIWYMLIFGVVGYFCKKLDYPIAPMVLALVLGDMAESALRQSLIMSQGSP